VQKRVLSQTSAFASQASASVERIYTEITTHEARAIFAATDDGAAESSMMREGAIATTAAPTAMSER
jgi:hypothetical protein